MATKLKPRPTHVAAMVLSLSFVWAPPAHAHAAYESSDPANGATVPSPPDRVNADFTEPLVDGSRLEVYDPCGVRVDNGDSFVAVDRITVSMSADKQGTYTVRFDVVSSVDGHPTNGEFVFTSAGGGACAGSGPEEEAGDQEGEPAPGTDDGKTSGSNSAADPTEASSNEAEVRKDPGGGGSNRGGSKARQSRDRSRGTRRDQRVRVLAADLPERAEEAAGERANASLPGLLFSLLLAAAVGAAGGKIYLEISKT